MSNFLSFERVQEIYRSFDAGVGIRGTAAALGLAKNTVTQYYRRGAQRYCPCGEILLHQGWCSFRYQRSPARQAFISQWLAGRPPKIIHVRTPPRIALSYPFIQSDVSAVEGADLVLLVNRQIPRGLPEQLRADVCQEILVSIISGELGVEQVPANIKKFIAETRRLNEAHYMAFSIDQPRSDGRSWHDILGA